MGGTGQQNHVLNRESGMVKGCFSKVLVEPRLLKLNFGIMCLHILLMSTFVALPESAGRRWFPAAKRTGKIYLVTMVISFVSVVPFIIYAEVKRKMKRVFIGCVAVLLIAGSCSGALAPTSGTGCRCAALLLGV